MLTVASSIGTRHPFIQTCPVNGRGPVAVVAGVESVDWSDMELSNSFDEVTQ
jgi:hypothetical protein